MIILDNVSKAAGEGARKRSVLTEALARLPSNRRIAVLGPHMQDKRLLIELLGGTKLPDSGRIVRNARVSYPVGYRGGFTRTLSVRLNVAHVARLYGADVDEVVDFVGKYTKLGRAYDKPLADLSKGAMGGLLDTLSFSIPFDVYVMGEEALKRVSTHLRALFDARCKTSGIIVATEDMAIARQFCDMGAVLADGQLRVFKNIDDAIAVAEETAGAEAIAKKARRERRRAHKQIPDGPRKRLPGEAGQADPAARKARQEARKKRRALRAARGESGSE